MQDPLSLQLVVFVCAIISLCGSLVITYVLHIQQREKHGPVTEILLSAVSFMVLCDACVSFWLLTGFWPGVGNIFEALEHWAPFFCSMSALWVQFFIMASINWFFVILLLTLAVLTATRTETIENSIRYQHLFAWGLSLVAAAIPAIGDRLGMTNGLHHDECWVTDPLYGMVLLYIPCFFYVVCALGVLAYTIYVAKRRFQVQLIYIISRILVFVGVFVCIWILPLADRFVFYFHGSSPYWLRAAFYVALALTGASNALVWLSSRPLRKIAMNVDLSVTSLQDTFLVSAMIKSHQEQDQSVTNRTMEYSQSLLDRSASHFVHSATAQPSQSSPLRVPGGLYDPVGPTNFSRM